MEAVMKRVSRRKAFDSSEAGPSPPPPATAASPGGIFQRAKDGVKSLFGGKPQDKARSRSKAATSSKRAPIPSRAPQERSKGHMMSHSPPERSKGLTRSPSPPIKGATTLSKGPSRGKGGYSRPKTKTAYAPDPLQSTSPRTRSKAPRVAASKAAAPPPKSKGKKKKASKVAKPAGGYGGGGFSEEESPAYNDFELSDDDARIPSSPGPALVPPTTKALVPDASHAWAPDAAMTNYAPSFQKEGSYPGTEEVSVRSFGGGGGGGYGDVPYSGMPGGGGGAGSDEYVDVMAMQQQAPVPEPPQGYSEFETAPAPEPPQPKPPTSGKQTTEEIVAALPVPLPPEIPFIPHTDLEMASVPIGSGSFGVVYAGVYQGNKVAVKVPNPASPADMHTMLKEVFKELVTQVRAGTHPHVVKLLGVSWKPPPPEVAGMLDSPLGWARVEMPRIVLEFMDGGDLLTYIKSKGTLPLKDVIKFSAQAADGLSHLHSQSVVHRDIALRNFLLGPDLSVRVADFGLARELANPYAFAGTSNKVGPLRWEAPEAILSRVYSAKSDVYMFGCAMFEFVTDGAEPWSHLEPLHAAMQVVSGHSLSKFLPDAVDPRLKDVMEQCWRPVAADRPTMTAVRDMLRELLATV